MAKRNNQIDMEVLGLAVAGLSHRAIARKLSLSQPTVSKILKEQKSIEKLSSGSEIINDYVVNEKINNRRTAYNVINKIINGLENDIPKASLKDKRELLKTLVELFGLPEDQGSEISKIKIEFEDASGDSED